MLVKLVDWSETSVLSLCRSSFVKNLVITAMEWHSKYITYYRVNKATKYRWWKCCRKLVSWILILFWIGKIIFILVWYPALMKFRPVLKLNNIYYILIYDRCIVPTHSCFAFLSQFQKTWRHENVHTGLGDKSLVVPNLPQLMLPKLD
jgi:hypothetical protein